MLIGAGIAGGAAIAATGAVLGPPLALAGGAALGILSSIAAYREYRKPGDQKLGDEEPQYRFGDNVSQAYTKWSEGKIANAEVLSRGGISVKARHHHGAPYVTKTGVGDTYKSMLSGIVGDEDDKEVASDLLNNTNRAIKTEEQKKNAAMMESVVGLAEEWRKRGASWVYRAILRGVAAGRWTMKQVPKLFAFVESANAGRQQVARFQDVRAGRLDLNTLSEDEQHINAYGSDIEDEGYDTEPEIRKKHRMTGKRLFSKKYQ